MHHLDWCANVVHTFWPVTTYSSPSRTALVLSEARSDPDSGSLNPWHQISSADRIGPRKRSFWSSLPWAITVGPPIVRPSTLAICGARARATSSKKIACSIIVAPAPPYSVGQVSPAHPRSLSARCQSRRRREASSSLSGSRPGWWSAIQPRTSSRNLSSAGDSVKSTRRTLVHACGLGHGHAGRDAARPRGERHAAEDQHEAGDGGDRDRLVEEDRAVEERDARGEVGDERGAARAGLVDELVEDDEPERPAPHAEADERGHRAGARRVARHGREADGEREDAGHRHGDPRRLHRGEAAVTLLDDEARSRVKKRRADHGERAEELADGADRLDADDERHAGQAEHHPDPLAAVDRLA